jgi:hypothetical protein
VGNEIKARTLDVKLILASPDCGIRDQSGTCAMMYVSACACVRACTQQYKYFLFFLFLNVFVYDLVVLCFKCMRPEKHTQNALNPLPLTTNLTSATPPPG